MTYAEETARTLVEARWRVGLALHAAQQAVRELEKVQGASLCDIPPMLENAAALGETVKDDGEIAMEAYYRVIRKVQANA